MKQFDFPPFNPCPQHELYDFWSIIKGEDEGEKKLCEACKFPCTTCKVLLEKWFEGNCSDDPPFRQTKRNRTNKEKDRRCQACFEHSSNFGCKPLKEGGHKCILCHKNKLRCELFDFTNPSHLHFHNSEGQYDSYTPPKGKKRATEENTGSPRTQKTPRINMQPNSSNFKDIREPHVGSVPSTSAAAGYSEKRNVSTRSARVVESTDQNSMMIEQVIHPIISYLEDTQDDTHYDAESPTDAALRDVGNVGGIPVPSNDSALSYAAWLGAISGLYSRASLDEILSEQQKIQKIEDLLTISKRTLKAIEFFMVKYTIEFRQLESEIKGINNSYIFASRIKKNFELLHQSILKNQKEDDSTTLAMLLINKTRLRAEILEGITENVVNVLESGLGDGSSLDLAKRAGMFLYIFLFYLMNIPIEEVK